MIRMHLAWIVGIFPIVYFGKLLTPYCIASKLFDFLFTSGIYFSLSGDFSTFYEHTIQYSQWSLRILCIHCIVR